MKIAIESFWLNTKELTGVGYYILNTLKEINRIAPGNTYYLLYTGKEWIGADIGKNFIPVCYGKGRATIAILFNLYKVIKKLNPDLYHAPFPTRVPPQKLPCPVVTTIHDLLALRIEGFIKKFLFTFTTHWAWKKSDHFLCNSNYTANEIKKYKNISAEKITVTYLAPAHEIKKWNPPGKHLLFVGSLTHRKNPIFLIQTYKYLCEIMQNPPQLTFVGNSFGYEKEFEPHLKNCPSNGKINWLKYVPSNQLAYLYANASMLVLPSKLEGFGMPLIESMVSGLPVLCSDIEVFKEIGLEFVFFVNGWDHCTWAKQIKYLLENITEREKKSSLAMNYALKFNWTACAEKTLEVYRKLT